MVDAKIVYRRLEQLSISCQPDFCQLCRDRCAFAFETILGDSMPSSVDSCANRCGEISKKNFGSLPRIRSIYRDA